MPNDTQFCDGKLIESPDVPATEPPIPPPEIVPLPIELTILPLALPPYPELL